MQVGETSETWMIICQGYLSFDTPVGDWLMAIHATVYVSLGEWWNCALAIWEETNKKKKMLPNVAVIQQWRLVNGSFVFARSRLKPPSGCHSYKRR